MKSHVKTVRAAAALVASSAVLLAGPAAVAQPEEPEVLPQLGETPAPPTIDLGDWPERRSEVVLPPSWAFGVLYGGYTHQEGSLEKVRRLIDSGFPIDAYWIDSWFWDFENDGDGPGGYLDFVGDRRHYPDPAVMWAEMERLGVKAGVWVWDRILRDGNREVWDDFMDRGFLVREWTMRERWHTNGTSRAAFVDFANPKAAFYWQEQMRPFFEMGLDFLKIDAEAKIPYMEAAFEATQRYGKESGGRGFILSHANTPQPPPHMGGSSEVYRYPVKWTGDAAIVWDQPNYPDLRGYRLGGLKQQVEVFANPDDKGHHPFLTMDTGGFSHGEPDDELFRRWAQFAAFTPVMCSFGASDARESNSPYLFDEAAQDSFRSHTRLRMQLFPYIYSYAHLSRLTSDNILRPVRFRRDQYFFGDELLVAPVVAPGVTDRQVYLPEGRWHDFWSGRTWDQDNLGTTRRVPVSPDRVPLFVRAGAIIPMRAYARSIEAGTNDRLDLHVWPEGASSFDLIEDDGNSNDYEIGRVGLTRIRVNEFDGGSLRLVIDPLEGSWEGMPERRDLRVLLRGYSATSAAADGRRVRVRGESVGGRPTTVFSFGYDLSSGAVVEVEGARAGE